MFDLKKSFSVLTLEKDVAVGSSVAVEGACIVRSLDTNGNEVVALSAGITGEKFAGFSQLDNQTITTEVIVEQHVIPASSPYVVQLNKGNISTASNDLRVVAHSKDSAVGVATYAFIAYSGSPTSAQVAVDYTNGILKFNSADAGYTVTVYYRRNVSALEAQMTYQQRSVNNTASSVFGKVGVKTTSGNMFTDQYVINYDYSSVAKGSLRTGANGRITVSAAYGDSVGAVIKIPTVTDPFLGVAFEVDND